MGLFYYVSTIYIHHTYYTRTQNHREREKKEGKGRNEGEETEEEDERERDRTQSAQSRLGEAIWKLEKAWGKR